MAANILLPLLTVNPTRLRMRAADIPNDSFFGSLVVVVDMLASLSIDLEGKVQ